MISIVCECERRPKRNRPCNFAVWTYTSDVDDDDDDDDVDDDEGDGDQILQNERP